MFNPAAEVLVIGKKLAWGRLSPYLLALLKGSFTHIVACGDRYPFMIALGVISIPPGIIELTEVIGEIEMKSKDKVFEEIYRQLSIPVPEITLQIRPIPPECMPGM